MVAAQLHLLRGGHQRRQGARVRPRRQQARAHLRAEDSAQGEAHEGGVQPRAPGAVGRRRQGLRDVFEAVAEPEEGGRGAGAHGDAGGYRSEG